MVKGATAAERAVERAKKKLRGRRLYFAKQAREASGGRAKVQQACRFAQSVAENELDEAGREALASRIVAAILETSPDGGDVA